MTNEERLRDALRSISRLRTTETRRSPGVFAFENAQRIAQEALDATTVSDMEKLREWLRERADSYVGREVGKDALTSVSVSPVRRQELEIVLDHIATEFGGGE